jgi:hypothetical protein
MDKYNGTTGLFYRQSGATLKESKVIGMLIYNSSSAVYVPQETDKLGIQPT